VREMQENKELKEQDLLFPNSIKYKVKKGKTLK
jgi:hypothetical protein